MTTSFAGRRRVPARWLLLSLSTALCSGLAAPASAQLVAPAPVRQSIDSNGVDLFLGTMNVNAPALAIGGDEKQGLSYYLLNHGTGWGDNTTAVLSLTGSLMTVSLGGISDSFTVSGTTYTPTEGNGATLVYDNGSSIYTYTRADGTVIHFNKTFGTASLANQGRVIDVIRPDGSKLTYTYASMNYCSSAKPAHAGYTCITHTTAYRIASIRNSYGYQLNYLYGAITPQDPENPEILPDLDTWSSVTGMSAVNLAVPSGGNMPTESFTPYLLSHSFKTVTDPMGRATQYRMNNGAVTSITRPGSPSPDVSIVYTAGRVGSVTTAAGTMVYGAPSDVAGVRTVTVTDPLSHVTTYTFDIASQRMTSMTDPLGHVSSWQYDASGRLTRSTAPEGNYEQRTYDARGNVTENRMVAKAGSGIADIVTSASFDATCGNPATCNQPDTTTDAKGNVTNYTYDPAHGGVLTVTLPAAATGAVRPQTRYSYSAMQAYFAAVVGGSITSSGETVYELTGISTCQTTASCAGTIDEVRTGIAYGPQTAGVGNNLLPVSVTKASGDASLSATTVMGYDDVGNTTSVDGPLAGTADTTTYRYDADRERVGVISADPDGAGALKRRAQRATYSSHGVVTEVEVGTVVGVSDSEWAAFASMQQLTTTLDAADRKVKDVLSAGGTAYQVVQYSYDAAGRPECTALRMNAATWGSLPSSACTPAMAGSAGQDRISRTTYDNANRVALVQAAYGTTDQANEVMNSYTGNGRIATVTDGQGNTTTYEYDGVDRLVKTRYPNTAVGAGTSSTTDYEQLVYDANGNVTSRRLRGYAGDSTQHIDYAYDNLGHLSLKDTPDAGADVTFAYDLLGRTTMVGTSGQTLYFTYDALGRNLTQGGPVGTMSSQYDAAGRRTSLSWPDGFYVAYDYLVTGEMVAVRENGATSGTGVLATYAYDDLGRRIGIARGNGTTTSYGYDGVSQLSSLGHDLAGAGSDLGLGFSRNPAGQITGTTRSNDSYAWGESADVDRAYSVNGLNQMTAVGGGSLGYDTRGNLTSTGSNSYAYSSENLLRTGPSSTALYYDPLLRLFQVNETSRFGYDGLHMAGEYTTANILTKRYVYGAGDDEPLVWYEGAGTSDRRWLHADERGSVIAITDGSGTTIGVNSYDEYGVPARGNVGRFQYTGQTYLPELGLYYYKARFYSSRLGRFMQTDPIGYIDGLNWYDYVGSDPINAEDPLGFYCDKGDPDASAGACRAGGGNYTQDVVVTANPGLPPGSVSSASGASNTPDVVVTGTRLRPKPKPQRQQPQPRCGNGWAAWIADKADKVSLVSGGIATTSGLLGLATAPTGAGFAGFESVAAVSGLVSYGAAGVGAIAHFANGDAVGGILDLGGAAGGFAVGKLAGRALSSTRAFGDLSASQARQAALAGNGAGTTAGAAASLYSCR